MRLETMETGEILSVVIDDGEPLENVPTTVTQEGHEVIARLAGDGRWTLLIRRGDDL